MDTERLTILIRSAQQGDRNALGALIDAYASRLYGYIYRHVSDRHEADDLLQETFVRLATHIGRYEHRNQFDAFVFRIALNLIRDRGRRRKVRGTVQLPEENESADAVLGHAGQSREVDPTDAADASEQADRLQRAIDQLPDEQKETIMLRHFGQLSFEQIAEQMGCPVGTALARAHRGLKKLRELMSEPSADSTADEAASGSNSR